MRRRLKKIRPFILLLFIFELGIFAWPFISALDLASTNFMASVLPATLDDLTNQNRQAEHLAVLTVNPLLNRAAELKAQDMANKGYFAHTSPDGKEPWYWFKLVGYRYQDAGENLAIDFTESKDVTLAWMNSPTHRANIVKNAYTEVGTGVATGTYEGSPTIFVAQVYGKPGGPWMPAESGRAFAVNTPTKEPASTKVLGASIEEVNNMKPMQTTALMNIFKKYLDSPGHVALATFVLLGILIGLAILFKLLIRLDKKQSALITAGLIALVLIFGGYEVNNYLVNQKSATRTSFVSFHGEAFGSTNPALKKSQVQSSAIATSTKKSPVLSLAQSQVAVIGMASILDNITWPVWIVIIVILVGGYLMFLRRNNRKNNRR